MVLITVVLMLTVITPLVASPAPVTRAIVEMESPVKVSNSPGFGMLKIIAIADIDECMAATDNCDNANCDNTIGSFTCSCNQGYSGNGVNCVGK